VLSVLAHPTRDVAEAALVGIRDLPDEQQARLYYDVIMDALPEAIRRILEAQMERYEYKTEFARKYVAEGRQRAIIELARVKLGALSADDEAAIRALRDDDVLTALTVGLGQARDADQARAVLAQVTRRP
jgi:hypothetical protein